MYSAKLLGHFQNPRFAGRVPEGNVLVTVENPICGDVLELQGLITNGVIQAIKFRAKGCVPSMACGSAVCQLVSQTKVEEALKLTREQLLSEVGGVPEASMHAAQLAMDALQRLLRSSR